jgi:hypothetical protein
VCIHLKLAVSQETSIEIQAEVPNLSCNLPIAFFTVKVEVKRVLSCIYSEDTMSQILQLLFVVLEEIEQNRLQPSRGEGS